MGEFKLGAGMVFIGLPGDDEFVPLGEVADGGKMIAEAYENYDAFEVQQLLMAAKEEATFTVHVPKRQMDNFLMEVFNIKKMVLDMMREKGHGRIAHLATHAKKRKTRKKNLHRAFRIPEKEEWQW